MEDYPEDNKNEKKKAHDPKVEKVFDIHTVFIFFLNK